MRDRNKIIAALLPPVFAALLMLPSYSQGHSKLAMNGALFGAVLGAAIAFVFVVVIAVTDSDKPACMMTGLKATAAGLAAAMLLTFGLLLSR